jgi:hypothetical protein
MVRHAMSRKEPTMTNRTILPTENTEWGFWGTMGEHAAAAWPIAFAAIRAATEADPDAVRAFLDSRHGRHFADEVVSRMQDGTLEQAVEATTRGWMAWRISRRTSRETGIPVGMPFLTGFVISESIAAEATQA